MHHLIYVPSAHVGDRGARHPLANVGLADHAAAADSKPIGDGPDATGGILFGWLKPRVPFQFAPDLQTWTPAAASEDLPAGRFWVGVWNDSPPTPEDLRRPGRDAWGEPVILAGEEWRLPPIDLLPKRIVQFEDGRTGLVPQPQFSQLHADRESWLARLAGPEQMVSWIALARLVTQCLAINYRIDVTLALSLGMYDEETLKVAVQLALRPRAYYLQHAVKDSLR